MLIKRRNPLQILPRKEIACEQANKEENVRENNEHCENLSVQDEDSTSPAMFEGKSSKLKVSTPRFCSTVGMDPRGSMGEGPVAQLPSIHIIVPYFSFFLTHL